MAGYQDSSRDVTVENLNTAGCDICGGTGTQGDCLRRIPWYSSGFKRMHRPPHVPMKGVWIIRTITLVIS